MSWSDAILGSLILVVAAQVVIIWKLSNRLVEMARLDGIFKLAVRESSNPYKEASAIRELVRNWPKPTPPTSTSEPEVKPDREGLSIRHSF